VKPLPLEFAARDTVEVAKDLLGRLLVHRRDRRLTVGRIVETEAYLGPHDLACHSSKGRTRRTEVMFGEPGHAYVYLIYGMYHCVNVVTGGGAAVLIRAVEPVEGFGAGGRGDGPGRLTKAMGLDRTHDGLPLDRAPLFLAEGAAVRRIGSSARIGVDYAGPVWSRRRLRFFDATSEHVSR